MRLPAIFEKGKIAAAHVRQAITYKDPEPEKRRLYLIIQVLIGLSMAIIGILLGYFFPVSNPF